MTIETIWYSLVAVYFFWITVCSAMFTALLVGAAFGIRNIIRSVK